MSHGTVRIVVIGASGYVGARLSERLMTFSTFNISPQIEASIGELVLFDVKNPAEVLSTTNSACPVTTISGNLTDDACVQSVVAMGKHKFLIVFHLAALLSGYSEDDFDLGMKINLFGTLKVMEAVRAAGAEAGSPQTYVYASTDYVACYNEYNKTHPVTEESFRLSPVSYGCQKACNEILISDYTRKGFIDGRVARLSAVIGRPGWSNSISYPYTGIFTQTLEGKDFEVSLPMDVPYPCSSMTNNVESILFLGGKCNGRLIGHNRVVQIPARSWTLQDIWVATQEVAKELSIEIGTIKHVESQDGKQSVKEINVCPFVDCGKAVSLGLPNDVEVKSIITEYARRYILSKSH